MFRGQFLHSVDAKGRISLPARFRELLHVQGHGRFVLTPDLFDPCLHMYPLAEWERLEAKVAELPRFDANVVRFRRQYVSAALECELDKAGRVLVPTHLRERTELSKEALWAGCGHYVELWSKPRFDESLEAPDSDLQAFKEAVGQIL